jgi:fluoride ion exporter CrcB/FEX
MLQKGNITVAVLYWAGSAIVGMIAVLLGVVFGRFGKAV